MLVALVVGLAISLFQALTQIQEMTLSFVPKLLAIFFSLMILLPYIGNELMTLSQELSKKIEHISDAP
jgi:flagellar biosynthetic protein FliQ